MEVDLKMVAHVARLAKLELSEADAAAMGRQLTRVLDYVAQLQNLPVAAVAPDAADLVIGLGQPTQLRPDIVQPSLAPEAALANAAVTADTAFQVPRILD